MKISEIKSIIKEELKSLLTNVKVSKHLEYHLENHSTLVEGVFRYGSDSYLDLFQEARTLHAQGKIQLNEIDQHLIENTDIGTWGEYNEQDSIDKITNIGVKTKNQSGGCSVLKGSRKKSESCQKFNFPP